jgi:hypothetical protein
MTFVAVWGNSRCLLREREEGWRQSRDTTLEGMETLISFEDSQAMPASPSDRGEILRKVIEVRGAALEWYLDRY